MSPLLRDPVNDFIIPQEWVERASIPRNELVELVESGKVVLLSDGSILRRGYTTGTTAAAASKAAVLSLAKKVSKVEVWTPVGIYATLDVKVVDKGVAYCIKIGGDHESDVTRGLEIWARAVEADEIMVDAGEGVGTVVRRGLGAPVARKAINSIPREQIRRSIEEACDEVHIKGAKVLISIPNGMRVAKRTLNPRLGVVGGISILGTTGFVEPWNDHLGEDKFELIEKARKVVLTTGRIGMRYSKMLFPLHEVVMVGSRIDGAMRHAKGDVVLCGLPGLILRWANPAILEGTGLSTVAAMAETPEFEDRVHQALKLGIEKAKALGITLRIVLVDRSGNVLWDTKKPYEGWSI